MARSLPINQVNATVTDVHEHVLGVGVAVVNSGLVKPRDDAPKVLREPTTFLRRAVRAIAQVLPELNGRFELAHEQKSTATIVLAGRYPFRASNADLPDRFEHDRFAPRLAYGAKSSERVAESFLPRYPVLTLQHARQRSVAATNAHEGDVSVGMSAHDQSGQRQHRLGRRQSRGFELLFVSRISLEIAQA